jgi:TatD DNase family protein
LIDTNKMDGMHIKMQYIDCHLHLSDETYRETIPELVKMCESSGVIALIANSENLETSIRTMKLSDQYLRIIHPAIGIHPWNATKVNEREVNSILDLIKHNVDRLIAIGEIGLDNTYIKTFKEKKIQEEIFETMLDIAEQRELPVIVHSRKSEDDVMKHLASRNLISVVMHWYSGSTNLIEEFISRGYRISFGPSVCYANHIQEIAKLTPIEAILTETDGPVRYRGPFSNKETTPELLPFVVQKLAEIKRMGLNEIAEQIIKNNIKAFPKLMYHIG